MPSSIDLNCDAGEVSRVIDDAMLSFVTSCNVCCGAHAGSEALIKGTISEAIRLGVAIGAHPSWPDRTNFGRQSMNLPIDELRNSLLEQILFVKQATESLGGQLQHVKPHGALYHDVLKDDQLAAMFLDLVTSIDSSLLVYGLANSPMANACSQRNIRFVHEAFGDRRYEDGVSLRSRKHDDALLIEETDFLIQIRHLIDGKVIDVSQQSHQLTVQTICLHSDTPNAVNFARLAHELISTRNHRTDSE